jgi:hypothetical protein
MGVYDERESLSGKSCHLKVIIHCMTTNRLALVLWEVVDSSAILQHET